MGKGLKRFKGTVSKEGALRLLGYMYLEVVRCTYNLLSNCSYNPIISRVTVVIGFILSL